MNLKKLLGLGLLSSTLMFGDLIDIDNQNVRDEILLAGFKNNTTIETKYYKPNEIDPYSKKYVEPKTYESSLLNWYLFSYDRENALKLVNDEFEWEDYRKKSKIEMLKKIDELNNKYINSTVILNTTAEFGDYNFDKELFPLSLVNNQTYFTYGEKARYSDKKITSKMFVQFSDIVENKHIMPMVKMKAKEFVKSKKDNMGNVNRELSVKYYLKIKEVNLKDITSNLFPIPVVLMTKCSNDNTLSKCSNFQDFAFSIITNISKVEIFDNDGKTLIHTINY